MNLDRIQNTRNKIQDTDSREISCLNVFFPIARDILLVKKPELTLV